MSDNLRIGGIVPFSTVDWPGKLACVAFLAGCPWRCPYCHNHELQSFEAGSRTELDLYTLLDQRYGLLDGVVFSGGEPLAQEVTTNVAATVHEMGFDVGIHTCGGYPHRLSRILSYTDWIGLDIKAPWDKYDFVTGVTGTGPLAQESLEAILSSGVDLECRTTWHPALLTADDIATIGHDHAERGVRSWAVQAYRSADTTGELPDDTVYPSDMPEGIAELFERFEFRRA